MTMRLPRRAPKPTISPRCATHTTTFTAWALRRRPRSLRAVCARGGARGLPKGPRKPRGTTGARTRGAGLAAQGLGNREPTKRLFLSEKTVAHHVSAILRKLDVRTRAQASAQAVRLGLAAEDR
jgi:hypothetical protein